MQVLDLESAQAVELIDVVEPHAGHTATVLTSGEVLIAGGEGLQGILASAELWGAASASVPLADRLLQPRAGHTATLLPTGEVLLAGGRGRGSRDHHAGTLRCPAPHVPDAGRAPTTQETVIATPRLPGFEIRIPAGTVVRDRAGAVVRQLSITPVPNDRPPFPMPAGVSFPSYFTVQPGGAHLETDPRRAAPGARVVYPNPAGHAPGSEADFWNYEPEGGVRWYRYGRGRLNAAGTEFEAGEGMRFYKFTMFTLGAPQLNRPVPAIWANLWGGAFGGDPVDLSTGLFVLTKTDLALADVRPLALTRTYRPGDTVSRNFGIGANHNYDLFLYSENGFQTIALILPGGERVSVSG